jgi:hypothetical protein
MIAIPIQTKTDQVLFVVLEQENLVRMKLADPADLEMQDYFSEPKNVKLVLCYEDDIPKLQALAADNNLPAMIEWLVRGRTVYDGEVGPPTRV